MENIRNPKLSDFGIRLWGSPSEMDRFRVSIMVKPLQNPSEMNQFRNLIIGNLSSPSEINQFRNSIIIPINTFFVLQT